jgi:hypothetical protein
MKKHPLLPVTTPKPATSGTNSIEKYQLSIKI